MANQFSWGSKFKAEGETMTKGKLGQANSDCDPVFKKMSFMNTTGSRPVSYNFVFPGSFPCEYFKTEGQQLPVT